MSFSKQSIIVWDSQEIPPDDKYVLVWKGYEEKKYQRSILKTLEDNSQQLQIGQFIIILQQTRPTKRLFVLNITNCSGASTLPF